MSPVWLTGNMTCEEFKEHHALEYEAMMGEHEDTETPG